MADSRQHDFSGVTNPKRVIERRLSEAESPTLSSGVNGVDKGDIQGPNMDFFKPRDRSKDAEGLARALRNRSK